MGYSIEIIFGKEQIIKHRQGEAFNDFENLINRKHFEFATLAERNAFYRGLSETRRWTEFTIVKEMKLNTEKVKEEPDFDYWGFITKYYPNYYHCNSVLLSDILTRKLDGEEIFETDEEYIKNWDVRKELMELDKELLGKAFENFFNSIYPENK